MQLTNILRDIKEDFSRGRIYLPQDELERFNVSEEDLSLQKVSENFKSLLKFQIERAREYYASSQPGIPLITRPDCRYVAKAMKEIYAQILNVIERDGYDVFSRRVIVPGWRKALLGSRLFLKGLKG